MVSTRFRPSTGEQSRRTFLAVGATVGAAALAGCSALANAIGERFLEDVVALNGMDRRVTGAITVRDPAGETVLDEEFDLPASEDDSSSGGSSDEGNTGIWSDVYTENGEYEVTVELDEPIEDVTSDTQTATVTNTEEEHIMVLLGNEDIPSPIHVTVIENFSDLGEELEAE